MDTSELLIQAKGLLAHSKSRRGSPEGNYAMVCEFFRQYAGANNSFLNTLKPISPLTASDAFINDTVEKTLSGFISYVEVGLLKGISPERKAQLDVVSDLLDQANTLLESKGVHPAAPAMLIGATLEEFLRTWAEVNSLSIGNSKPGIDTYAKALREADLITKQDIKDITAWAGIRNHAAHGEWEQVSDKSRVLLMLEGINLFMRKYSS